MGLRSALATRGTDEELAFSEAQSLVSTLYEVTFGGQQAHGPFCEPYIVSFCSHKGDQPYERNNGLLSQWRGYGDDVGFALVFDTKRLCDMLEREGAQFHYSQNEIVNVFYDSDLATLDTKFDELLTGTNRFLQDFLLTKRGDAAALYQPFVRAAARLKHQGFREEREVRIVVSPILEKFNDAIRKENPNYPVRNLAYKPVEQRESGRRFVRLLDTISEPLPIIRIIVGPSAHQSALVDEVQRLAGRQIPVICSETPFVHVR